MLRGIDKRNIFLDDEDRKTLLDYLTKAKEKSKFSLYGYCLMDNHFHLLMKEGDEPIGESIKRITVGYVQRHNLKYSRTGHLFQNRYKSEAVNNEQYLLHVLRYIHQNPIKAGLVNNLEDYNWSSYKSYLRGYEQELISTELVKCYLPTDEKYIEFMKMSNNDNYLEYDQKNKFTDSRLMSFIVENYTKPELIAGLPRTERNAIIKDIKMVTGASNRQLSRVLGIGRGIIERI